MYIIIKFYDVNFLLKKLMICTKMSLIYRNMALDSENIQ